MGDAIDDVTDRLSDPPAAVQRHDGADAAPDRSAGDDADGWAAWTDTGGEG
jgi:hypothetical protein